MDWLQIAQDTLAGESMDRPTARRILQAEAEELPALLNAAFSVRRHYFGMRMKLCMLINAQCGMCSEDCAYCSQSKISTADISSYGLVDADAIVRQARQAAKSGAINFSIVTSGRGPTQTQLDRICEAIAVIKAESEIQVCASLGLLKSEQAQQLAAAGLDRYHHNINTSAEFHSNICSTHTYEDRVRTVRAVKHAGLSSCCGVIVGMGEEDDDIIDMALELHDLAVDSIPINFLMPVPGTPLADQADLTPLACLRVLCLFRLVCADQDIRVAGGREHNLRSLQPLVAYPANAMFVGDLLTTSGPDVEQDRQMLTDLGFTVELN